MTATIVSEMKELRDITKEIKELSLKTRTLRQREKELKKNVLEYLQKSELPGIRFNELIVMQNEKENHRKKKKDEQTQSIIDILEQHGIDNSKQICDSIQKSMIGETYVSQKLKVKIDFPDIS